MSFSGRIIEEWLLTGKAVVKNLSCGNAGLTVIPVPEGKTYIITKIEVLPFANIFTDDGTFGQPLTFSEPRSQDLGNINERSDFQLLFWNERLNNTYNIRNSFSIGATTTDGNDKVTIPANYYTKHSIECFSVVESDCWLFLKYKDFLNNAPNITQTQLNAVFNKSWPPSPFWGYLDQFDIINYNNNVADTFSYVPQGLNTSFSTPEELFNNQYTIPALGQTLSPLNTSSFVPPGPLVPGEVGYQLSSDMNQSIPIYNIEYIEINRRLSITGLL
jgi:hypothetical protein